MTLTVGLTGVRSDFPKNDPIQSASACWVGEIVLGCRFNGIRQRNYRVDKSGGLAYRRAAAQAVGVSAPSR